MGACIDNKRLDRPLSNDAQEWTQTFIYTGLIIIFHYHTSLLTRMTTCTWNKSNNFLTIPMPYVIVFHFVSLGLSFGQIVNNLNQSFRCPFLCRRAAQNCFCHKDVCDVFLQISFCRAYIVTIVYYISSLGGWTEEKYNLAFVTLRERFWSGFVGSFHGTNF